MYTRYSIIGKGIRLKTRSPSLLLLWVEYLGHFIHVEGVETDPAKVQIVKEWPKPPNVKQ